MYLFYIEIEQQQVNQESILLSEKKMAFRIDFAEMEIEETTEIFEMLWQ